MSREQCQDNLVPVEPGNQQVEVGAQVVVRSFQIKSHQ